jgi:hypothetical protein
VISRLPEVSVMKLIRPLAAAAFLAALAAPAIPAAAQVVQERVDLSIVQRIRDEALKHSQADSLLLYMSDVIGPRLTGSLQLKQAHGSPRRSCGTSACMGKRPRAAGQGAQIQLVRAPAAASIRSAAAQRRSLGCGTASTNRRKVPNGHISQEMRFRRGGEVAAQHCHSRSPI